MSSAEICGGHINNVLNTFPAITCQPKYNETLPSPYGSVAEKKCSDAERVSNGLQSLRSECGINKEWTPPLMNCRTGKKTIPFYSTLLNILMTNAQEEITMKQCGGKMTDTEGIKVNIRWYFFCI